MGIIIFKKIKDMRFATIITVFLYIAVASATPRELTWAKQREATGMCPLMVVGMKAQADAPALTFVDCETTAQGLMMAHTMGDWLGAMCDGTTTEHTDKAEATLNTQMSDNSCDLCRDVIKAMM